MYADDTVVYVHGSNISQVAEKITNSMVNITAWLNHTCLQLNTSKTLAITSVMSQMFLAQNQSAFSVRAATEWNLTPINIRNLNTYSTFKIQLRKWLVDNQSCQH